MLINNEPRWRLNQVSEITVVVPCYNHSKYIERCLRSIFAQTRHPKMLIVINDGSTDNSAEIIEKVLKSCPFPNQLITQKNSGQSAGINRGFEMSDTKYFAYLGADDIWLSEFLEERIKLIEMRPDAVAAYGNAYIINSEDYIFDCTKNWMDYPDGNIKPMLYTANACPNPSVIYKRDSLKDHRWNENSSVEDFEMYLKLSTIGEFAFDKNVLCAYRIHDSNMSHDYPRQFRQVIEALERCREMLDLSEADLEKIKKRIKIGSVDQFIRTNNRRIAFKYLRENADVAESKSQVAKLLFRLMIPSKLFQWNRKRKKESAINKYGKLKY